MTAARDVIFIIIVLFVLGIGFFTISFMVQKVTEKIVEVPVINETNQSREAFENINNVTNRLDYVLFGVFLALALTVIITGYFVGGLPIFMFFYFLVVSIGVILSVVFSNVWEMFTTASVFGTSIANFPIMNHVFNTFPVYTAIIGIVGIIAMFAKPFIQNE